MRILVVIILMLLTALAHGQTHTMPGSNVVPSGASLTINSGGSITAAAGSTVTGFGGGAVSLTATTPIIVTPSPTTGTGVISLNATSKSNWDTAFTQMLQWDGGATNLVAATARTSLALVPGTNVEVPLTFSTGLTRSTNTVTVNTSQNIATLSNLTTNGFVKTGGAVGTLSVDTATYQASNANLTSWAAITRASGIDTFATTPSSANLRSAVTDENGTGALLFSGATTPDFTTGFTIGAAAASRKIVVGDGTKFAPSTETWPVPGTAGNIPVSDGTNWTAVSGRAEVYTAGSGAGLATCCAANTVIPGSTITLPAGAWKQGGSYRCTFDMAKNANGILGMAINVHMGTLGTTSDAIVGTATFAAGTAAADSGVLDVFVTFKSVGSGTSAVVVIFARVAHALINTGLASGGATGLQQAAATSSGFASTTQTKLSIGFNGGTSFSGTNVFAQAEYTQ